MSIDQHSSEIISDYMKEFNSPEKIKERERTRKDVQDLADEVMARALWCEKSDLNNNVLIACLRENVSLYKEYADSVNQNLNLKKIFGWVKMLWPWSISPSFSDSK